MNTGAEYRAYEAAVDSYPVRTVVVGDSPMMLKTLSLLLEREDGLLVGGDPKAVSKSNTRRCCQAYQGNTRASRH
jgi:hypothetical protein